MLIYAELPQSFYWILYQLWLECSLIEGCTPAEGAKAKESSPTKLRETKLLGTLFFLSLFRNCLQIFFICFKSFRSALSSRLRLQRAITDSSRLKQILRERVMWLRTCLVSRFFFDLRLVSCQCKNFVTSMTWVGFEGQSWKTRLSFRTCSISCWSLQANVPKTDVILCLPYIRIHAYIYTYI